MATSLVTLKAKMQDLELLLAANLVPREVRPALATSEDPKVRRTVAHDERTNDLRVLESLCTDENWRVREAVAMNRCTPATALKRLAVDKSTAVQERVALNPSTPPATLVVLSEKEALRHYVATNPSVPAEHLEALSKRSDFAPHYGIVRNPTTPEELFHALLPRVLSITGNDHLFMLSGMERVPLEAHREIYARTKQYWPWRGIFFHPRLTPEYFENVTDIKVTWEKLMAAAGYDGRDEGAGLAKNELLPGELLRSYASSRNRYTRRNLAGNLNAPLDAIEMLLRDKEIFVLEAAFANPRAQQDAIKIAQAGVLAKLAKSKSALTQALLEHGGMP